MLSEIEIKADTCKICGNSDENVQYIAKEMMYGMKDEFVYFECNVCHCLQIQEFPKDMSKYYPDNYYSFGKYNSGKFKGIFGSIIRKQYSFVINGGKFLRKIIALVTGDNNYSIFQGLGVNKNTKILDVGCGNGRSFLYPLAEIGFKNLLGCDPYLKTPFKYSNGLQIMNSKIYDVKGIWDIITYHHSFEHIDDPKENIRIVSELLAPNGVCIIRIPTVSSFAWEHYRTNWVQLDAPRHYFLHSVKSMQTLAEIANLELYKTVYDSTYFQFSGSEKYLNDIPLYAPRPRGLIKFIQRKFKKSQFRMRAKQFNYECKGDQAAFYFRKKADTKTSV
jgi:2-polyprenyl-3-methyl-5-hydroxy-6-metoxy-1,4-benzoquinol methylase